MKFTIIGLAGKARAGKSTAARLLEDKGALVIEIADPLKRACMGLFDFSEEQLWGPSRERDQIDPRWSFSPRVALQTLGTEWARALCPDYLVREFSRTVASLPDLGYSRVHGLGPAYPRPRAPAIVVPDVRFPDEVACIRTLGGVVMRVGGGGLDGETGAHVSETALDEMPDEAFDGALDGRSLSLVLPFLEARGDHAP